MQACRAIYAVVDMDDDRLWSGLINSSLFVRHRHNTSVIIDDPIDQTANSIQFLPRDAVR